MSEERGPQRIQRKRTKGWRMPENAVYVGRPTKWGNPWKVGGPSYMGHVAWSAAHAVELYDRGSILVGPDELRGKDLACWCPLDQPCHADVLLDWANRSLGTRNSGLGTRHP